ncbi:MAG: winged helix-turn-helix transcriptional regulator [Tissierellia bacterium]|nr:winged helix-turn-helix transcriptional regulator [Tissierellia bacterium]
MSDKTRDKLLCQSHESDENIIKEIRKNLLKEEEIKALSNIFKALSDPTRLKIIYILSKSSLCVCDIADLLDMSQSAISHQLRILRDLKLVKYKRDGKLVIYSLDDDHVLKLFEQGLDHVRHR